MNLRSVVLGVLSLMRGVLFLIAMWLVTSQVAWWRAERTGGYALAEDTLPYGNAHLIEEAFEGRYNPVRDPPFLFGSVLPTALAFAVSGFWCARRGWHFAALVGAIGVALLSLLYWDVIADGLPGSIKAALALQVGLAAVASAAGAALMFVRRKGVGARAGGPTMR